MVGNSSRLIARRVRLLESELLMLQNYLNECQSLLVQYEQEYSQDISYFISCFGKDISHESVTGSSQEKFSNEISTDDPRVHKINSSEETPGKDEESTIDSSIKKKHPDWAKSLYRKIATITHPDKIKKDERKKKLEQHFQEASRALEESNYNKLISLALSLDLKSSLGNKELLPLYKDQINSTKEEISKIEKSSAWIWGEGFGMVNVRSTMLKSVLNNYKLSPDFDAISEAIKSREKLQES